MWLLQLNDIHHALKGEFVEVKAVAHVVVGRYGLRVIVNHHRAPAFALHREQCIHATPVKLHRASNAVSTRAEHHYRAVVVQVGHIILAAVVGEVEVIGLCRIFGCKCVNLLHHRCDTLALAQVAYLQISFVR